MGTIETYRVVVCLVVVNRTPLDWGVGLKLCRTRAIVMIERKDVVQSDRHHVVDARLQHQLENAKEWKKVCMDYFSSFNK